MSKVLTSVPVAVSQSLILDPVLPADANKPLLSKATDHVKSYGSGRIKVLTSVPVAVSQSLIVLAPKSSAPEEANKPLLSKATERTSYL